MYYLIVGASVEDETDDRPPINYVMTMPLIDSTILAIRQGIAALNAASSILPELFEGTTKSELRLIEMNARRMMVLFWNPPVWDSLLIQGVDPALKERLQEWTQDDAFWIADIEIKNLKGLPLEYLRRKFPYKSATATFTPWKELGFADSIGSDNNPKEPYRKYQSVYFNPDLVLEAYSMLLARNAPGLLPQPLLLAQDPDTETDSTTV